MKTSAILFPLLVATMISCNNTGNKETANVKKADSPAVAAAPAKDTTPLPPMDSATMMKKMQESMTPGDMQKMLASYCGTWSGEITMWMDPSKPPAKYTGVREIKMILGGRYQLSTIKSTMDGMPVEASSTTGYDNAKKVFFATWIDNMGTGILLLEGPWDAATKTIILKGKMADPTSGKDMDVKETVKMIDDKHQLMEFYSISPDGKENKIEEVKYTKK